jgi:2-polyprenyl-3-methyl-5-hydroxy-6-metoxy-1,4-benzoquinol methylase
VTGVEPAEAFIRYALHREESERLGIEYVQADLSTWTPPPDPFDMVIANMVLMDIPDYELALRTCVAALATQGGLIVSLLHPCFEEAGSVWKDKGYVEVRDYFRQRAAKQEYGYFIHRPLSTYLNSIMQAGCVLQRVIEPQLEHTVAQRHHAERYWLVPGYIVLFAIRSSEGWQERFQIA